MSGLLGPGSPRLRSSPHLADVARLLDALRPGDPGQAAVRDRMLAFARAHPDALHRTCGPGHFTASALVVDHAGDRLLFLFHAKHRVWVQPGGHADGDGNLVAVALREATEETGIAGLRIDPHPLDLDIHPIGARPGEPAHDHLDVRFLVVAPPGAEPVSNHESEAVGWFGPGELDDLRLDESARRLVDAGRARLASR